MICPGTLAAASRRQDGSGCLSLDAPSARNARRLESGSESHRVDLDFYLVAAWRLMEQVRQAMGRLPSARRWTYGASSNTRFPYLDENRDRWIHATDRIVNHSYFADDNALDAAADHPHR